MIHLEINNRVAGWVAGNICRQGCQQGKSDFASKCRQVARKPLTCTSKCQQASGNSSPLDLRPASKGAIRSKPLAGGEKGADFRAVESNVSRSFKATA
jgi:hypothetical protein